MGPDRLDKFIQDKVFDHQTATDTDALWEGILAKQAVKKEPKRRFAWWWFMAGLALVLGLASYGIFSKNETTNNTIANKKETSKSEKNDRLTENNTTANNKNTSILNKEKKNLIEKNNIEKEASLLATAAKNIKLNSTTTTTNSQPKQSASTKTNTTVTKSKQSTTSTDKSQISLSINSEIPNGQVNLEKKTVNVTNSEGELNTTQHSGHPDNNTFSKEQNSSKPPLVDKDHNLNPTKIISTASPNRFKKESHNNLTTNFSVQSLLAQIENDLLPILATAEKLPKLSPVIKPNKKPSPFSLGFAFGYGFAKKQLKSNIRDEDASEYIGLREESETPMQVISGGVDLKYQFRSGFYVKAGLQYEQITERFDFNKTTETSFFNDTATLEIHYLMDGSIEKESGTESMIVRTRTRKIYNRYRTFDTPLSIGYQQVTKNKLNWFIEGGLLINLAFVPHGEVLNYNGTDIIDLSTTDYLKKNIGLSLTAGAGLSYRVTKRWSVWASPKFRMPLTGMTEKEYLVDQRFLRGVVELGGRLGF